ncbi:MAG: undecaprenyl-diphosphate phosphatase [Alphaproteobacteria bacterium]|nr:MAG: undecaprenyl-diphosphate phosphatase [Alphaproteobacteria bacterium]
MDLWLQAVLLGVLEAATEFLPVSSTGHLILMGHVLGFDDSNAGDVFKVVIQLGAILAICVLYFSRLWGVLTGVLRREAGALKFASAVLIAFLPAAMLGVMLHGFIKETLFNPFVVCVALIVGGFAILLAEKMQPKAKVFAVEEMGFMTSLKVGACQCLALVPGVSRSGATILGGLLVGLERKVATEFSFFLAIPTMFGATAYDLFKNRDMLNMDDMEIIGIGFVTTFVVALLVVKWAVAFITKHGFAPFAYYRIVLGSVGLAALLLV